MSTTTANKRNNHRVWRKQALHLQFTTQLLLLLQLTLFTGCLCFSVAEAAELPAELMLEGVSLLKSMEYAQQHHLQQQQHQVQHKQQQHKQQHPSSAQQLHGQTKRFAFSTTNSNGADIVDIDSMQPPALSSGDISRFERELFLASAIEDDDSTLTDNIELPMDPESMENGGDLMEHANDYNNHPAAMWLQQHNNNDGGGGGDGKKSGSTFLKLHHPLQQHDSPQQKHRNQKQQPHQKHVDGTHAPPSSPTAEPQQRYCSIEISTKLTGACETMSPIGAACVAGDYMDVYNQDCL